MSIGLGRNHVSQNARLHTEQNVYYGSNITNYLNPFVLWEPGFSDPACNGPGPWARYGLHHRLRAPNRPHLRPSSRNARSSGQIPIPNLTYEQYKHLEQVREQKVEEISVEDNTIQNSYDSLQNMCIGVEKYLERDYTCLKTIEQEVSVQKVRFVVTSQALRRAVEYTPLNKLYEGQALVLLYTQLIDGLKVISKLLGDVPYHLRRILSRFQQDEESKSSLKIGNPAEASSPDQEFKDVLENVEKHLENFYSLANSLIEQPIMTEAPEDVERLYSESQAATALFQCFSQACPVDDHSSHTVYLGVSTDERTHMGIQSRATSQNRVWFCVRSNPTAKRRKESMSSTVMQVMNTSSRKRKRPSDIPMRFHRPLKSRKANRSQAMNQVQVCPEYLTQGEDSNLAMRMVAAPREWHNIYFLESEKRPPDGHMPMKLANLFDDSRREHRYDFSWRVHVARLIAEAVLRIQHPESPCRWCEKDVVFYTAEPYDDNLKPFLKVEVERGGDGTTLNIAAARKPGRWLLNLALILLELGLSQHIEAPPDGMGEEEYREHILWHVEQAKGRSLEKYLTVVRSCVTINSRGEGGRITVDEHSFHEDFYRLIIFPLKMIENDLKPPEYLSNTYYPMAGFSEDNR